MSDSDEALAKVAEKITEKIAEHLIESTIKSRADAKARNRSLKEVVKSCKYVYFDFQDWNYESLNLKTTSYFIGIPAGTLRVTVGEEELLLECGPMQTLVGSDIVHLYKWCARQAPSGTRQRGFRFERGEYKGSTRLKNWQSFAIGGIVGGLILAAMK